MFAADLVVGARSMADLERAVRTALDELDLRVIDEATVADSRERFDAVWSHAALTRVGKGAIEAPSVALGLISASRHTYTVDVRGPRSPLWHLALAQRLSLALGGWTASRINDRLHDDYGYGVFLAGHAVEGGARAISGLVTRFGIDPRVTSGQLYAALDEDVNTRRFQTVLARLSDGGATWPRPGGIRVLFLATKTGEAIDSLDDRAHCAIARLHDRRSPLHGQSHDRGELPWLALSAEPRVIGTLAGLAIDERDEIVSALDSIGVGVETFDVDPSYDVLPDGSVDEAPTSVLLLSARPLVRAAEVLDALAHISCPAAAIELDARTDTIHAWARPLGLPFVRMDSHGVDALAQAWEHVAKRTALPAMRWTFPAAVQRPYR